ncbi:DrmB family protein [Streptosporangium sp. OZ121]|uniref:DrmB family protein n=1 Tax=Streptosporangium sp. OZ121 TaxID=3444183 RepID=UPI003F794E1A
MADSAPYRRRVGAVRPSHLMFTSGVGSIVDLPNFSVLVKGLEDWRHDKLGDAPQVIAEPRLLAAVQSVLGKTVTELKPAPWLPGIDSNPNGDASRTGVPVMPFPSWMRCTACNLLAPIDTQAFGFRNDKPRKPHEARFFHECGRGSKPRLVVGARFVLACTAGHLDDFPYLEFVHRGEACAKVAKPNLLMQDFGGNIGANVRIRCQRCDAERNIREVMGRKGREQLPNCRGRHPHLGTFAENGCGQQPHVVVVGASNQWFAQPLSALAVPKAGANELDAKIEQFWANLQHVPGPESLPFMRSMPPLSYEFEKWADNGELWAAIVRHRGKLEGGDPDASGQMDLLTPEWQVFSAPTLPEATDDFTLYRHPDGVPSLLKGYYADVIQAERLREVRAMIGFTRLDAPDFEDPELVTRAPLTRSKPTWVPASEVRGEGIFLKLPEDLLVAWEERVRASSFTDEHSGQRRSVPHEHREAYGRFREYRYSDRIRQGFDKYRGWPGLRYYALHTLSHLLIRTIALECGYNSASLSERIYAGGEDDPRSGILIYTAVPDAEGTLGGLVSLAEPEELVRLTRRALSDARRCSSDPLCAERLPRAPEDFLHGAACHVCLFVSETTCERGNRFLDRRFIVPVDASDLALYPEIP